jgi:type IV pilus assembly protein PilA
MSSQWYYADAKNQQQGPVEAAWLANAFKEGSVAANTLVWREGLAAWVPLSQIARELGLVVVGAPALPPAWTTPAGPTIAKPASSNTWIIVVVVLIFGFIAVIGILAAIAVPAYAEYTTRAKIAGAIAQVSPLKAQVAEFFATENRCPSNGEGDIGAPETYASTTLASVNVGAIAKGDCGIRLTFKNLGARDTEGKQLLMTMDGKMQWQYNSDFPTKFLPASMRQSMSR